jgi:hypothetical protein
MIMIRFYRAVAAVAAILAALTVVLILSGCGGTPVPATPTNTFATAEPVGEPVPFGPYFRQEVLVNVSGPEQSPETEVAVCLAEDSCRRVTMVDGWAAYTTAIIQTDRYAIPHARIESVGGIRSNPQPPIASTPTTTKTGE